jgi:uncharacterized protein (TIGR00251 family)
MDGPPPRWYRRADGFLVLSIHVQPGARRTEVAGLHGDSLKVRIHAPALEDRANDALVEFVAGRLGIAKRQVTLVAGARSREKTLRVPEGCDPARLAGTEAR